MSQQKTNEADPASEVLKQIGSLNAATKQLKDITDKPCAPDSEEAVNIITVIGRALLKIFGVTK